MKHQALFSSKDKSKELKCRLLQFLFGALRVKPIYAQSPRKGSLANRLDAAKRRVLSEVNRKTMSRT